MAYNAVLVFFHPWHLDDRSGGGNNNLFQAVTQKP